jgi:choline dehydrogenase-like flavoprotein
MDARSVHTGSTIETDLAIVGGGPAGISLALALADADAPIRVLMLESGGLQFDRATQSLYAGEETGVSYIPLENTRLRYLGGCSNHWGGWCRPLDPVDFEPRGSLAHSGWPFGRGEIGPISCALFGREAGPLSMTIPANDECARRASPPRTGRPLHNLFQFSKQRGGILPAFR